MPDNKRPDPRYRPGGTTDYYEGMLPFYEQQFGKPQPQILQPPETVSPIEGLIDEPSTMDKIKSGAKRAVEGVKSMNRGIGLTDQTLRGLTTAAQIASGAGSAAGLIRQLKPAQKPQIPVGKATANYPLLTAPGLLGAGIGSGVAIGTSSADIPASP